MFNAKYGTRLQKDVFTQNYACCLGEQLLELLNFIKDLIPPHVWYGANIDTNFNYDDLLKFGSFTLNKIYGKYFIVKGNRPKDRSILFKSFYCHKEREYN